MKLAQENPHYALAGARSRTLVCNGKTIVLPDHWVLTPPGDPALTRRLKKAAGEAWYQQVHRHKNRWESDGIWCDAALVTPIQIALQQERRQPDYQKKLEAGRMRRAANEQLYGQEFQQAVEQFLAFAEPYQSLAVEFAQQVTCHAIPVGSGTVARTERIPLEERAEAAVIAWMRHQTTAYDSMQIAKIKGERRAVRRMLAERSRTLLEKYRRGVANATDHCVLYQAICRGRKNLAAEQTETPLQKPN